MRAALSAALAAALAVAAPARADETLDLRATSPDPRLGEVVSRVFLRDCRGARRTIDRLWADPGVDAMGLLVASIWISEACEPPGRRPALLAEAVARAESRDPDDPTLAAMALSVIPAAADPAAAERRHRAFLARFPDRVPALSLVVLRRNLEPIASGLGQETADRLRLDLLRAGAGTSLRQQLDVRDGLLRHEVRFALAAGDTALAQSLADQLVHPGEIRLLLMDRDFAPLWAATEARVGSGMAAATARGLEAARAWARETAEGMAVQPRALRNLALALWNAGHRPEALAEAGAFSARALEAGKPDASWLRLGATHVHLLAADGRMAEAERRSRDLLAAAGTAPELVAPPLAVRARLLVRHGLHTEALALAETWRPRRTDAALAPAVPALLAAEACARQALARADAGGALRRAVEAAAAADTGTDSAEALLCLGDAEAAEAEILALLADPVGRDAALVALLPAPSGALADPLAAPLAPLAARPKVASALARVARPLPATLLPR